MVSYSIFYFSLNEKNKTNCCYNFYEYNISSVPMLSLSQLFCFLFHSSNRKRVHNIYYYLCRVQNTLMRDFFCDVYQLIYQPIQWHWIRFCFCFAYSMNCSVFSFSFFIQYWNYFCYDSICDSNREKKT